jgi:acyl-CoA thioesterase FadM
MRAPEDAFVEQLRVRSYEVGRDGTIGFGTLLRYLELVATDHSASLGYDFRWYELHGTAWFVRTMDLWLGAQPSMDDRLRVATWVAGFRRVQARREYAITRADTGALVVRASARWGYVDRMTGRPRAIEDELLAEFAVHPGHVLPPGVSDTLISAVASGAVSLTARTYEADTQGHINNSVYGDWLMEALRALGRESPAAPALRAAVPRRVRLDYVRPVQAGDGVRIVTTASVFGSRRTEVEQAIFDVDTGAICLTARATCLRMS